MSRRSKRKMLANGRNGEGQYWKLHYDMAQSDAWHSLSGAAVKVLIELRCRFDGGNNGRLTLSLDEAAHLLGLGKATVVRALAELQAKGFVVEMKRGRWYGRMATEWATTDKAVDGVPPSNAWRQWTPENHSSVLERTESDPNMVRLRTEKRKYGPSQNPSGAQKPPDMVRLRTAPITMADAIGTDLEPVVEAEANNSSKGRDDAESGSAPPPAPRRRAAPEPERCPLTIDVEAFIAASKSSPPPADLQNRYSQWLARQPRGTEGKVGGIIGVSRPQLANFRGRRFGLSPGAAEKLARVIERDSIEAAETGP